MKKKTSLSLRKVSVRRARKIYWACNDAQVAQAKKRGYIETLLGWRKAVHPGVRDHNGERLGTKVTSLINFPLQAADREILRVASILLEKLGFGEYMCYPHHDSLWFCAPTEMMPQIKAAAAGAFQYAGWLITDNKVTLRVDSKHEYAHPAAYHEDDDVARQFQMVVDALAEVPNPSPDEWETFRLSMLERIEMNRRKKLKAA